MSIRFFEASTPASTLARRHKAMVMVTCPKCKRRFEKSNFPHPDHVKPWCEECLNKYLYDKKA